MKKIGLVLVVVVLTGCSGATPEPLPTYTPYPTLTSYPTYTPWPTCTPYPTYTEIPTVTPSPTLTSTPTPAETNTPWPTPTPKPIIPLTFPQLQARKADQSQTDAQWAAYRDSLIGQRVHWAGAVKDVSASGRMTIDMEPTCGLCWFSIPASESLNYRIGQRVTFEGDIDEFDEVIFSDCMFVDLVDAIIID